MVNLKTPLICAGAAFFVSIVIGFISGVQLFSVLLRGLIAGVILGCFAFAAAKILERFIPDVFTQESLVHPVPSGEHVNITLDDGDEELADAGSEQPEMTEDNSMAADKELVDSLFSAEVESKNTESETSGTMNDLPAMDELLESDAEPPDPEAYDTEELSPVTSGFSLNDVQTTDGDTKIMAQAIRTILQTGE